MQFDTFVFPVDPETLHTTYRHDVSVTPTTGGQWTVENVAYLGRTVEGEGVFYGSGVYQKLSGEGAAASEIRLVPRVFDEAGGSRGAE